MKKHILIFAFIIVMMCHGINVFATDIEKIDISYFSPDISVKDLYSDYTALNEKEIQMLSYYLKSLQTIPGGGAPSDVRSITITTNCDTHNIRYDIYPNSLLIIDMDKMEITESYKISLKEYYQLCGFINSLILDKFDENEPISTQPSEWAKEDVDSMVKDGLLSKWHQIGYSNKISRVEVCQMIDDMLTAKGIYEAENLRSVFDDTDDKTVNRLYEKGIVTGISETEFDPYDNITREEFAAILNRTYDFLNLPSSSAAFRYTDENSISEWAKESVNKMYAAGLMQGNENGEFKPKDILTKQEVIVVLRRLADMITR